MRLWKKDKTQVLIDKMIEFEKRIDKIEQLVDTIVTEWTRMKHTKLADAMAEAGVNLKPANGIGHRERFDWGERGAGNIGSTHSVTSSAAGPI